MRVRTADRDAEELARQYVGGGVGAPDERRARSAQPTVRALRAAQAELHHVVVLGGQADAGGLGGHEGGVVERVEDGGLQQLCLRQGRLHPQQRLLREDHGSLRYREHGALRPERAQEIDESGIERAERRQIGQVLFGEVQTFHQIQQLFQAGGDGEAVVRGQFPEEVLEADKGALVERSASSRSSWSAGRSRSAAPCPRVWTSAPRHPGGRPSAHRCRRARPKFG